MRYTTLFIWLTLCKVTSTQAQSLSFQINSMASNSQMTIGGLSFQIDHLANCYFLANGLSIYIPQTANRVTDNGCKVSLLLGQYGLKIYPQPIGNHPRVQLTKWPIPNEAFTIKLYTIEGRMVLEEVHSGLALSTGTNLNTSKLFAGAYIMQVLSENSLDILQVIKQD